MWWRVARRKAAWDVSLQMTRWIGVRPAIVPTPDASMVLGVSELVQEALDMGAVKKPEVGSICHDGHNTGPVQNPLVVGGKASCGVAEHFHDLDSS